MRSTSFLVLLSPLVFNSVPVHLFQVIRALRCPYPLLRSNAAEQLYECLAAECVLEDEMGRREKILDLLASTNWQVEDKEDVLFKISDSVAHLLNVS